jgi:fibronectin type 3 domain-containing protein
MKNEMRKMKHIYTLLGVLLMPLLLLAQSPGRKAPSVRMIGRADSNKNAIYLRWASTTANSWKLNNKYGFMLERYTVIRNKQMLPVPEKLVLSPTPLKARVLEEWETLAKKDNNAAVIAQALYGSDFNVSINDKGAAKILAQSQELEQRFSFSLYAADNSFEGALMAGWAFVDKNVKPDEKYLYRLKPAAPSKLLAADSVSVFISPAEYEPLPAVQEVIARFGNKGVLLNWDIQMLSQYFASYYVEKSDDGGASFKKVNGLPVSNFDNGAGKQTRMFFMDSLKENGKEYRYRVVGVNPFGQSGPPSTIIKGMGKDMLAAVPNIRNAYVDKKGVLQVNWIFDEKGNKAIRGFQLKRASTIKGPYENFGDTLAVTSRTTALKKELGASNYFTITALAKEGEGSTSFPYLVQPEDSMPPAIPAGVKAVIDTNGVVTITWDRNIEKDLMGYKVFRAQKKGEELVPLVDSIWYGTKFRDTLSLKMLNKKSYYAVTALDTRFNQSAKSVLIEVKKPEVIPPSPAVISKFKVEGTNVTINWISSSDPDVVSHTLYRKLPADTSKPVMVRTFQGHDTTAYTDKGLTGGKTYIYYVVAKSEGGLTTPSEELTITTARQANTDDAQITRMYAYTQPEKRRIEITWDHTLQQVAELQVYKAEGGKQLVLWKVLPAGQNGIYDTNVQANTEYQYGVMAVFTSGAFSSMKTVTTKY